MITRRQRQRAMVRVLRFIKYRILHVDDSPHSIALGMALGILVAYMPPFGFHIILVTLLSFLFRANKFVSLISIWICNPFTYVIIYYPNCRVGRALLDIFEFSRSAELDDAMQAFTQSLSFSNFITNFYKPQFWSGLGPFLAQIGWEMFVGGLLIGGILAVAGYVITKKAVILYRIRHPLPAEDTRIVSDQDITSIQR
ncbi:MAG: DUF2062 domain-containing protein [Sedimentisphaerales bacterium]|nr:DUF2062 domain-containing protein [Sedimentisphaerales bacterium]